MQSAFSCQAFDEDGIKCALSTLAARHTLSHSPKTTHFRPHEITQIFLPEQARTLI